MASSEEQHVCMESCSELDKNAIETFQVLEVVFGEQTVDEYKFLGGFLSSKGV